MPPSAGCGTEIVEEYILPKRGPFDAAIFRLAAKEEADKNGIKRPKGYKVSWHMNANIEKHHFGRHHPMKPWRLTLTKGAVMSYGMQYGFDSYEARPATMEELKDFHDPDYMEYLKTCLPVEPVQEPKLPHNLGGHDCPVFEGIFDYCSMYAGASIDAARKLCTGQSDIAINWSGGLHHAKKSEASGFCFVNDIVLAIQQLLRYFPRVLYIDIDVHHGDGVEEAFASTDRVMTVSFHKYDPEKFFPGTGALESTGPEDMRNLGAHHSINVPLDDGIDDAAYGRLFESVIGECNKRYRPAAIVLQCGADSLAGDRLGSFNLMIQGHGNCVAYCKTLNIPLLLIGGGGYTPRNVARAWTNETAIAIGADKTLNHILPAHTPYRSHFRQDTLFPTARDLNIVSRKNKNDAARLDEMVAFVHEQLRFVEFAPSVQMQQLPKDILGLKQEVDDEIQENKDEDDDIRRDREEAVGEPMEMV